MPGGAKSLAMHSGSGGAAAKLAVSHPATAITGPFANAPAGQGGEPPVGHGGQSGVWQHEQLEARARWREVGSPAGPIPALLPPGRTTDWEPRMDPVPALGQHTRSILSELGCSEEEIAELDAAGAI